MEIRHLRYFIAIAEYGGFVRAANRLYVTQSALSRQIRDLEQELNVTLFDRTKRGVRLTYPGECFLEAARRLVADLERAQITARNAQIGKVGTLTIGLVSPFSWHPVITQPIRAFHKDNPNVALSMVIMNSSEQLAALRDRRISAGFLINAPPDEKDLESIRILTDKIVLAVPDTSPFAQCPPKRLVELSQEDFFWTPRKIQPSQYDQLSEACSKSGLVPRVVGEGMSDTANLSLVAAGLGCAFVPSETRWRKPEHVTLVPVGDLKVAVTLDFTWHRENRQEALNSFIQTLVTDARLRSDKVVPSHKPHHKSRTARK